MELNYIEIGKRIRKKRLEKDFTQEGLAGMCGLSIPHISNIERGATKISLQALYNIAIVLECSTDELLFGYEDVHYGSIIHLIEDCDDFEKAVLTESMMAYKRILRNNRVSKSIFKGE